jgi:hypothetical protein
MKKRKNVSNPVGRPKQYGDRYKVLVLLPTHMRGKIDKAHASRISRLGPRKKSGRLRSRNDTIQEIIKIGLKKENENE